MPQHREKRILPFTPVQLFDLVAAIDRYPEFLPWCRAARLTGKTDTKLTADLIIGYKMFQEKFTSQVTLDRPRSISVRYLAGPMSHLTNHWVFVPSGPDACEIGFEVEFDFRSPLLRSAMDMFFEKALARMVNAFEERARTLYRT